MRGEKKTDSVSLRVTTAQKQRIERSAADLGITFSEFCRRKLVDEAGDGDDSPIARTHAAQRRRRR